MWVGRLCGFRCDTGVDCVWVGWLCGFRCDTSVDCVWVGGFVFLLGFFFFLDASVDLIAQWEVGVSILREMVADDGDCGDCVGSVREVTVLKKLIFYLNKCV